MNPWPPPPRREEPPAPTPNPLSPLRPLALTVACCFVGVYLALFGGGLMFPRWLASAACMVLWGIGYVLSLVLGVLFVRRTAETTAQAVLFYVLLILYALGFLWYSLLGENYAGL